MFLLSQKQACARIELWTANGDTDIAAHPLKAKGLLEDLVVFKAALSFLLSVNCILVSLNVSKYHWRNVFQQQEVLHESLFGCAQAISTTLQHERTFVEWYGILIV